MPVVCDMIITPSASAPVETSAIAASPLIRLFSFRRSSRKAAAITTGTATESGAAFSAVASASEPKPTLESPLPIME